MKTRLFGFLIIPALLAGASMAFGQGTAFTYQGRLNAGGLPATGLYDLRFTVFDAATNGDLVAGPLTNSATGVTNGHFAVTLDFGDGVFTGPARWLEVDVQTNGTSPYIPLWPLQALTATPYAIMAGSASNLLGTLPVAQLPASVLTNNQTGVVINGIFNGNGAGLTNLNIILPSAISGNSITVGATNEIAPLTVPPSVPAGAIGSVGTGWAPYGLALTGRYAYVVNYDGNTLQVIDVSTPSAPAVVATVSTGSQSNPKSVAVAGRYAYVADYGDSGHNLQVFDVSDPASPVSVGTVPAGYAEAVVVSGRYAYVTGDGNAVEVFDLSNPAVPVEVGSVPTDVPVPIGPEPEPPALPILPPVVPPGGGGGTAIAVSGRYAYVVNYATGAKTLNIIDVSNPAAPVSVGSAPTASYPSAVAVSGRYAYVTSDSSQGVNTLQVFDVSNPAAPVNVGSATAAGGWAFSLAVAGRYAYVANYNASTLQLFDVSNPAKPVSLGQVATGSYPQGVVVSGRYAYVANYVASTLQVFDLGGAYVQQLEAGTVETGILQTRDTVTVGNNLNVRGGLTVSGSARISGGLSVDNGIITAANITGANITATSFSGNGAGLVNVPASGLSGGITTNIVIAGHTFYYTNGVLINIQ